MLGGAASIQGPGGPSDLTLFILNPPISAESA